MSLERLIRLHFGETPTPEPEPPYRPNPEPDPPEHDQPTVDPENGIVVPIRLPGHPGQPMREHAMCGHRGHFN